MKWVRQSKDGEFVASYEASEVREIQPGIWFVVRGMKKMDPKRTNSPVWNISLDLTAAGDFDIKVNPAVGDEIYTIEIPADYAVRGPDGEYQEK
jgi:hypothetical protein